MAIACFAIGNPTGRNSYFRQHHRDVMFRGDAVDYRSMLTLVSRRGEAPGTYADWRNWAILEFARVEL